MWRWAVGEKKIKYDDIKYNIMGFYFEIISACMYLNTHTHTHENTQTYM